MPSSLLTTSRTQVDLITLDDASFFVELMNSPGWLAFIGDRNIHDADSAEQVIRDTYLRAYDEKGYGYYVIRERTGCEPMGICGFLQRDGLKHVDFGFAVLPQVQGQGLAYEACSAVLTYGATTFGFVTLDAITKKSNHRSIRLLEKLNFTYAGDIILQAEPLRLYQWSAHR